MLTTLPTHLTPLPLAYRNKHHGNCRLYGTGKTSRSHRSTATSPGAPRDISHVLPCVKGFCGIFWATTHTCGAVASYYLLAGSRPLDLSPRRRAMHVPAIHAGVGDGTVSPKAASTAPLWMAAFQSPSTTRFSFISGRSRQPTTCDLESW